MSGSHRRLTGHDRNRMLELHKKGRGYKALAKRFAGLKIMRYCSVNCRARAKVARRKQRRDINELKEEINR